MGETYIYPHEGIARFETHGPIKRLLLCQVCGKSIAVREFGRPPPSCPECGLDYPYLEVPCKEVPNED